MFVLRSLERSTKPKAVQRTSQPLWVFFCPAFYNSDGTPNNKRGIHNLSKRRCSKPRSPPSKQVEDLFISTLLRASLCRRHSTQTDHFFDPTPFTKTAYRIQRKWEGDGHVRRGRRVRQPTRQQLAEVEEAEAMETWSSIASHRAEPWASPKELKSIVDFYDHYQSAELPHEAVLPDPLLDAAERNAQEPIHPSIEQSSEIVNNNAVESALRGDLGSSGVECEVAKEGDKSVRIHVYDRGAVKSTMIDLETWSKVERIHLLLRVEDPSGIPHDQLFDAYINLPQPRVSFLSDWEIHQLLTALSWVQQPSEVAMVRYLAVLDELRSAARRIDLSHWTTAVHMSARWKRACSSYSVDSALEMWRQMEVRAGVKADVVTFTILFSIAAKAKRFALADVIFREMVARRVKLDRLARLARIAYHGLRGDGEAVRYGYARFVDAGEIVNTVALNCVISAFLNAGEPSSAEHVFQRMKDYHAQRLGDTEPPEDWKENRKIRRIIRRATQKWRDNPVAMRSIQDAVPVAPDTRTYEMFIDHYAKEAANIDRVWELVHEMKESNLNLTARMFPGIFRGFFLHGGVRYSQWTLERLEEVWNMFTTAVEHLPYEFRAFSSSDFTFLAFAQCASIARCEEIRDELRRRWRVPSEIDARWQTIINSKRRGILWNDGPHH